jgi:hypothetical protein
MNTENLRESPPLLPFDYLGKGAGEEFWPGGDIGQQVWFGRQGLANGIKHLKNYSIIRWV